MLQLLNRSLLEVDFVFRCDLKADGILAQLKPGQDFVPAIIKTLASWRMKKWIGSAFGNFKIHFNYWTESIK